MHQVIELLSLEKDYEQKLINLYGKELKKLPKGSLRRKKVGKQYYYYHQYKVSDGTFTQKCLGKSNGLIELLKRKRYIKECLPIMHSNVKFITACINGFKEYSPTAIEGLLSKTYENLPMECYKETGTKNVRYWLKEPYHSNAKYPENKIHQTTKGDLVRSKSEALIAGLLTSEQIPYRYESLLQLNNTDFYPDFTVYRPKDGKIIYWEHFGLSDNEYYLKHAYEKILLFYENNIVLWDNLIISFDRPDGSIDVQGLQKLIQLNFL